MKRSLVITTALVTFFAANYAYAAQNVANTSQKGSLLIFPAINVDQTSPYAYDTSIELSNDSTATVHVECEYINERKDRVNFDFDLTGKATASWDVGLHIGDQMSPAPFPTGMGYKTFPGDNYRGELICFATDPGRQFQIPWNELTGSATVLRTASGDSQIKHAFKYNAWSFAARCAINTTTCLTGVAADSAAVMQGKPGTLSLSGANAAGAYDGCPVYNVASFMPNGSTIGSVTTDDNWLSVVSCNQDLREVYNLYPTKLDFTVWNSAENSFTGAYICADGVESVYLGGSGASSYSLRGAALTNFDYSTLRTPNARFQVRGINAGSVCGFGTYNVGLLGVVSSTVGLFDTASSGPTTDQLIGTTTSTAGTFVPAGFVYWDVSSSVPNVK